MDDGEARAIHQLKAGRTRVLSAGEASAVIFVHGVGMNADIWRQQIQTLSPTCRVMAYDMLNHGEAPSSQEARAGLDGYVDQLLEIADELDVDRFHLVGHSMGALVATAFALAHPRRVISLAALNAVWRRDPESSAAILRRVEELKRGQKRRSDEGAIARWFGAPIPPDLMGQADMARRALASVDPAAYARSYDLFARADRALEERLHTLQVPALFMTGELDPNSTPAMSREMARIAPQGRAVVLPGERHMMFLTAPSLVNEELRRMMRESDAR